MIPVRIDTLVVGTPPAPSVLVLRPLDNRQGQGRVLPIWIGPTEAISIGMALQDKQPARPMTHDLFGSFLEVSDAKLDYVIISNVIETTFFATVVLTQNGESKNIDARPSDSIALAIREKAPIYVEDHVLDLAAFPEVFNPVNAAKIETEAFHEFIEKVNPEDFKV
mgnify:CR=1 FL=1